MPESTVILDSAAIQRALTRVAHEIAERNENSSEVVLVGIPEGGVPLAQRLGKFLAEIWKHTVPTGSLDVSMHRDDIRIRPRLPFVAVSHLPPDLEDRTLILADDVLFSGRTCRAAMDSIASFGRPRRIQLAVLIDRGHRELPIRPDYVGKNLPTSPAQRVYVRFQSIDKVPDSVWMDKE